MSSPQHDAIVADGDVTDLDFSDTSNSSHLAWAYAIGRPSCSGIIRQFHDDFVVSEILGFEPGGVGEHVYLEVEKCGVNTSWLATQFARFCGVRTRDIGYAGRKDRHARTRQWFSCWLPGRKDPDWSALAIDGATILRSIRHTHKLKRGRHEGNAFEVLVREVPTSALTECMARLSRLSEEGFPNYFGEQRFGRSLGNLHRAKILLQVDSGTTATNTRDIGREDRGLAISAARALMFNRAVSEMVNRAWHEIGAGEEAWLPGSYRYEDNPSANQFGLIPAWFNGLKMLGVKAMRRPVKMIPRRLSWDVTDGGIKLSFELPRGSYATSLLRELFDYRVAVAS